MSETPRTKAEARWINACPMLDNCVTLAGEQEVVPADVARDLELELTAALREKEDAVTWIRVVAEEMALAGFSGGDRDTTLTNIRTLRAQITEIDSVLASGASDNEPRTPLERAQHVVRERDAALREREHAIEKADSMTALVQGLVAPMKKLLLMARTAGGWRPDADLMTACEQAEAALGMSGVSKMLDEREALLRERDEARSFQSIAKLQHETNQALRAQVERLREVLHGIASWSEGPEVNSSFDEPWAAKAARAALSQESQG